MEYQDYLNATKIDLEQLGTTKQVAPKNDFLNNKLDYSLIPMDLLGKYLVPAYMEGLEHYWRDSWRLNFNHSRMVAAARRHLSKFWDEGEDYDTDVPPGHTKHHLAGVIFSCLCMLNVIDTGDHEKDDRRLKPESKLKEAE